MRTMVSRGEGGAMSMCTMTTNKRENSSFSSAAQGRRTERMSSLSSSSSFFCRSSTLHSSYSTTLLTSFRLPTITSHSLTTTRTTHYLTLLSPSMMHSKPSHAFTMGEQPCHVNKDDNNDVDHRHVPSQRPLGWIWIQALASIICSSYWVGAKSWLMMNEEEMAIWNISTLKRRRSKMNKHKYKKRMKKLARKTKKR